MNVISRRNFIIGFANERDKKVKTLVCIFLRGGADTLNIVVPYGNDDYYKLRPTIAIAPPVQNSEEQNRAIKLDDYYGFHPLMRPLISIFKEGRLAIVQGVGSDNTSGSHFEAQDQMEHGEGFHHKLNGGWIGRYLQTRNKDSLTPLSVISIGSVVPESLRSAPNASAITSIDEIQLKTPSGNANGISSALSEMYGANAVGMLAHPAKETINLIKRVETLRGQSYTVEGNAQYAKDDFSAGLREIARLIKANVGLEIACIDLDGWDTHFFQGTTDGAQSIPIDSLARGLAAFDADLQNYRDRVTTIVMTEFGRRNYENSSFGTDHGRGFAFLALGNQIKGGIYGELPELKGEETFGPGGLKVKVDYRSVLSEAIKGIGENHNIDKIFPDFEPQPIGFVLTT